MLLTDFNTLLPEPRVSLEFLSTQYSKSFYKSFQADTQEAHYFSYPVSWAGSDPAFQLGEILLGLESFVFSSTLQLEASINLKIVSSSYF